MMGGHNLDGCDLKIRTEAVMFGLLPSAHTCGLSFVNCYFFIFNVMKSDKLFNFKYILSSIFFFKNIKYKYMVKYSRKLILK